MAKQARTRGTSVSSAYITGCLCAAKGGVYAGFACTLSTSVYANMGARCSASPRLEHALQPSSNPCVLSQPSINHPGRLVTTQSFYKPVKCARHWTENAATVTNWKLCYSSQHVYLFFFRSKHAKLSIKEIERDGCSFPKKTFNKSVQLSREFQ